MKKIRLHNLAMIYDTNPSQSALNHNYAEIVVEDSKITPMLKMISKEFNLDPSPSFTTLYKNGQRLVTVENINLTPPAEPPMA